MYKIEYNEKSVKILKKFIESYKNTFLERFSDTGIYDENIIKNNYINRSISFYEEIIDGIDNNLSQDIIFGYHPIKSNKSFIFIKIFNYNIKIYYKEFGIRKIRKVYNIEFHN